MSIRTLIEINHDIVPVSDAAKANALMTALARYVCSGSREHAEELERYGLRVLGMRHHSGNFILDGEPDGFPVQYLPRSRP